MAMYDWNHNGKNDRQDDYLEYMIYKDCTNDNNSNTNHSSYNSDLAFGVNVFVVIAVIAIFAFIGNAMEESTPKCIKPGYENYLVDAIDSVEVKKNERNPKTIVNDRYAPKEIKSQVIRADQLVSNMKNIIATSNDFASTKKEMMSIAQGILDMNIESRKDYAAKYEELVKENELSDSADTKNEISDSKQSVSDDKLICPKCGSKLVLRTANKGENAGKQFYGCSNFPKCRFILNIKK
jgi:predicted RNA-binding Zn-ribbon protein involved in translation (DUF1610 family)